MRIGDVVNVIGTSTCIMAISEDAGLIPGVCGVVRGSIHPSYTGIEAGLSATGDIFDAIARRADSTVAELSAGLDQYRIGQTGLLRLTWDNGDRTVLVNPELGGVTLGWKLNHTAQDELFAAIEGTAFHTRVILERMEEHGVPVRRVINGGGIPQRSATSEPGLRERARKADPGSGKRSDEPGIGDLCLPRGGHIQDSRGSPGRDVSQVSRRRTRIHTGAHCEYRLRLFSQSLLRDWFS